MKQENKLGFVARMPEESPVPERFQVFPFGTVEIEGSAAFVVDETAMDRVVERFAARGLDMVIDYEHQTEGGVQAPAAGWIKRLENRGKAGLWAVAEWTERAREYLAAREYRYYSPVFLVSGRDKRLAELLRVALTNAPRLNWIRPIVAKHGADTNHSTTEEEQGMEFLKTIAKQIGLPETAGAEEVSGAVRRLQDSAGAVACKEVLDALGLAEGTGKSEAVATIHALKQARLTGPDLTLEVAALKRKLAERERDDLVDGALKAGKITPAQREWAEKYALGDPEGFTLFVSKAPQVVPLDALHPAAPRTPAGNIPDTMQLYINKLMGIDEKIWEKYQPENR